MFRLLFIPVLLLFHVHGNSQTTQLKISAKQQGVIVHLNSIQQSINESLTLEQGTYLLESWAPTYQYFKDTITLKAGVDTIISITLSQSSGFLNYEKELKKYRFQAISMRYVAPAAYLGVMGFQLIGLRNKATALAALQAEALSTKTNHDNAVDPVAITTASGEYRLLKEQYAVDSEVYRRRQQTTITTGIVLGLVVVAFESIAFRLEKPEYKEETRLSFQPYFSGNAAGIAISWP